MSTVAIKNTMVMNNTEKKASLEERYKKKDQEKAEKKWKTKRSESGFSGKGISGEITGNKKEVRVKITGKVPVWGRPHLEFETKIGQKIIRPVIFVRKVIAFRT